MSNPKPGIFSSFMSGRAAKSPRGSETLAHPLLGASTSSLNLSAPSAAVTGSSSDVNGLKHAENETAGDGAFSSSQVNTGRSPSSPKASTTGPAGSLPYKAREPRHRHGHTNSASSITTIGASSSSTATIGLGVSTSPTAGTSGPAPPTTTTSTTFAISPSSDDTATTSALGLGGGPSSMASSVFGSSSISGGSGNATSRLQLQSMKASAQKLGLGNGSMGMGMIDTVFEKVAVGRRTAEGEWGEVLKVLSAGKAVLLLPATSTSSLPITPQILRDHIAYLSTPMPLTLAASRARSSDAVSEKGKEVAEAVTIFTTLSGICGTIKGTEVSVEAIFDPNSRRLAHIRDPTLRSGALSGLRPTSIACPDAPLPSYSLSEESTSLVFPPMGKGLGITLDGKETKVEKSAGKLGRINPFSSLFGGKDKDKDTNKALTPERAAASSLPLDVPDRAASPAPSSPRPSVLSMDIPDNASIRSDQSAAIGIPAQEGFTIQAYTISKTIKSSEVQKNLSKALKTYVRAELAKLPERVVERIVKLVSLALIPPAAQAEDAGSKSRASISPDDVILALDFSKPAQAGERLQDIMEAVYDDLLQHYRHDSTLFVAEGGLKRKASASRTWSMGAMEKEKGKEKEEAERAERVADDKSERRRKREERAELQATEGTERVEGLVTRLLYNQLFSPLDSDDTKHDEALASRIAALNMLDLSLDHLGLITRPEDEEKPGAIAQGLAKVVSDIGEELQKLSLPTCLTPKEKADVLVAAHQLVVDGLSDLPPIALRPEGEIYQAPVEDQTPRIEQTEAFPHDLDLTRSHSATSSSVNGGMDIQEMTDMQSVEEAEATPHALRGAESAVVPELVLTPDASPDEAEIERAMSESLHQGDGKTAPNAAPASVPEPSKPKKVNKPQNSGADLILPIIIYAVVRSNPPQLASQLMYLRRYRSAICLTGEASYAMVNVTAVVEFLEHVNLAELGLGGDSDKVMSIADLSPIGLDYLGDGNADAESIASASTRLRGRVFQVGELAGTAAGSANKVITGVLDSSWSAMRGLISSPPNANANESGTVPAQPRPSRPRQASTFSLASTVASIAAAATTAAQRSRAGSRASEMVGAHQHLHQQGNGQQWQGNQELVEVTSRPESINEAADDGYPYSFGAGAERGMEILDTDDRPEQEEDDLVMRTRRLSDARSIRSVASAKSRDMRKDDSRSDRVSLSDRLANIGSLGRVGSGADLQSAVSIKEVGSRSAQASHIGSLSPTRAASNTHTGQKHARRSSLLSGVPDFVGRLRSDSNPMPSPLNATTPLSPASSSPGMPITRLRSGSGASRIAPSIRHDTDKPAVSERFMTCEVGDIRLSEVGELLREYRKLAAYVDPTTLSKHA